MITAVTRITSLVLWNRIALLDASGTECVSYSEFTYRKRISPVQIRKINSPCQIIPVSLIPTLLHLPPPPHTHNRKHVWPHSPRPSLRLRCSRALHLPPNHGASPQEAPPDLCQRFERRRTGLRQGQHPQGEDRSPECSQVQRWW